MTTEDDYAEKIKYVILPSGGKGSSGIIKAVRNIPLAGVKKGDIGGEVSGYHNLSQEGDCWVDKESKVLGSSRVEGNVKLSRARISENSSLAISGSDYSEIHDTVFERCSGVIHNTTTLDASYFDNYKLNIRDSKLVHFRMGEGRNRNVHEAELVNVIAHSAKFTNNVKIISKKKVEIENADFLDDVEILEGENSTIFNCLFEGKVTTRGPIDVKASKFSSNFMAHDKATVESCRFQGPVRVFGGGEARLRIIAGKDETWITKGS